MGTDHDRGEVFVTLESPPNYDLARTDANVKEIEDALLEEIRRAGREIFAIQTVTVSPALLGKHTPPPIALCASCGEAYPQNGSTVCPACQGMDIYV